jgi:deoxycytidine triphosphate deaminase
MSNRVTQDSQRFENLKKSDFSQIFSNAEEIQDFSIELTLGNRWSKEPSVENHNLKNLDSDKATIPPQGSIVVESQEEIRVPNNLFGLILTTGSLLRGKGVFVGTGKIEPFFRGKLRLLLMNNTNYKIEIYKGDKLASAIFFRTETTAEGEPITLPDEGPKPYKNFFKRSAKILKGDTKFSLGFFGNIATSSFTTTLILLVYKYLTGGD